VTTALTWFAYCLRHYSQFNGRASRLEYWSFYAVVAVVGLLLLLLSPYLSSAGLIIKATWSLGVAIPHLAVMSRRLHDSEHSFWWAAPPFIGITLILFFAVGIRIHAPIANRGGWTALIFLALLLFWLGFILRITYLLCKRGSAGPNAYGEPAPRAPN